MINYFVYIKAVLIVWLLIASQVLSQDYTTFDIAQFDNVTIESVSEIAVDSAGNILVAGFMDKELEAENTLTNVYVHKYSPNGQVLWTQDVTSTNLDFLFSMAVDNADNVLVAGQTYGDLEATNEGLSDVFIRKIDSDGNILWTQQFGTPGIDFLSSIAFDNWGNIFVAGNLDARVDSEHLLKSEAFIYKYTPDGEIAWKQQSEAQMRVEGIAVDSSGNVLMVGHTGRTVEDEFGSRNLSDLLIRKYSSGGEIIWTKQSDSSLGGPGGMFEGIVIDSADNFFIVSQTDEGSFDTADDDIYFAKYSTDGDVLWEKRWGTYVTDFPSAVVIDNTGDVLIAGFTNGMLGEKPVGGSDVFICKFTPHGEEVWVRQLGSSSDDRASPLAIDKSGDVLIGGSSDGDFGGAKAESREFIIRMNP